MFHVKDIYLNEFSKCCFSKCFNNITKNEKKIINIDAWDRNYSI